MEDDEFVVVPFPGCDGQLPTTEITTTSHEPNLFKGQEDYTGPLGNHLGATFGKDGQKDQGPHLLKLHSGRNTLLYPSIPQYLLPPSSDFLQNLSGPVNSKPTATVLHSLPNKTNSEPKQENKAPNTQLGLTNDEIALLRHHQEAAAAASVSSRVSSSRACSTGSSQGLLLLDGNSLAELSRHFDRVFQQIQGRLDLLSELAQACTQQNYDGVTVLLANADIEIEKTKDVLEQIDKLDLEFDKIRNIRDIFRYHRSRVEALDHALTLAPTPAPRRSAKVWEAASPILGAIRNPLSKPKQVDEEGTENPSWNATSENSSIETGSAEDTETTYESGSEFSNDWCSPVDWQHHFILEAIMAEFYAFFNRGYIRRPGFIDCSPSAGQSSSSGSGSLLSGYQKSSTSYSSNSQSSKRSNGDGRFPHSDDQDDGNKRPRILSSSEEDSSSRRYACPFYKHNPIKYSQRGSCTGPGFKSISHLKEHLYRCHMAPIQCPRCWIEVGEGNGLEIHLNGDTQCQKKEPQPAEGVCSRKFKLLKSKKKLSPEPGDAARWSDIFRILFPGVQPIPSPYYERVANATSPASHSDNLSDFRQYSQTRLPSLIETHVGRILERELQPLEARIKSMVQDITRKCLSDLVRDWQTSEFGKPSSYSSPSQPAGPRHEALTPHHPIDFDQNSSWKEDEGPSTEKQLESFVQFDLDRGFDHLGFLRTVENDNPDTQNADWMYSTTLDSTMNTGSNPFEPEFSVFGSICLEFPPHPDPQNYEGKGKGREEVSSGGQDLLCTICFPHGSDSGFHLE